MQVIVDRNPDAEQVSLHFSRGAHVAPALRLLDGFHCWTKRSKCHFSLNLE